MTKTSFKIEKNVPEMDSLKGGLRKYPFNDMEKGDSFDAGEYDRKKMQSIYGSIYFYIKQKGNSKKKFSCRKTENGTMRIWRTA